MENTEKVVVIFDRVDQTAITVIESLGGEIQKQEAVKDEQHPLIGKWVKCVCVDADKGGHFRNGKWYQCMSDVEKVRAFINDKGQKDGFHPHNYEYFNLTDARDYNPDEVKALVGKLVKHKESGEYHLFVAHEDKDCEVEGVVVCIGSHRKNIHKKNGGQYVLYTEYNLKDFKEKEVELLVPDSVKFYEWAGDLALEVSEGMFLSVDGSGDLTLTTASSGFTPIKCKLVPVKYEDVKVGDFVVPKRGLHNKSRAYSMKHGDDKFCSAYFGSFKFNDVLAYKRAKILKVVRC
jgi:co-chaperonin GroES (HSP10)